MRTCPHCGTASTEYAHRCAGCGHVRQPRQRYRTVRRKNWEATGCVIAGFIFAVFTLFWIMICGGILLAG